MSSTSFEKLIQAISPEAYLNPQERDLQLQALRHFLHPFQLRDNLTKQLLQPINEYACHLKMVSAFFPQYPLNEQFETDYSVHTLSLPDKITFIVKGPHGDPILIPCHQSLENDIKRTTIDFPGADSFTRLEDGSFLASGQIKDYSSNESIVFHVKNNQANPVVLSSQAREYLKKLQVTNLYGFFQYNDHIFFGTWGQQANARILKGQFQNLEIDRLEDVTPEPILAKGYDDLFIRSIGNNWFQIGIKLGVATTDAAVYLVNAESNQVYVIPLNLGEIELGLNYKSPKEYIRHTYNHQFYEMSENRYATITSGRLGSILRIIDAKGNVYAKYFINLPNDLIPIADYAWLHLFKHPTSPFLYIPDNNEVIHRFSYDASKNTLYVLKFRLPISGEITALTATPYGFCIAITCNHRNIVLKVTEELTCFNIYEKETDDTPFTILHVNENSITALTGGRFHPYYNFSRYCHYLHPQLTERSEIISIHTKSIEADRSLAESAARHRQKTFLEVFLQSYPKDYQTLVKIAMLEFEAKNYQQCCSLCIQAIEVEKTILLPYRLLAKSYAALHRYEEALKAIVTYLQDAHEDKEIIKLQQYCCKALGQEKQTERSEKQVLVTHVNNTQEVKGTPWQHTVL